METVLALLTAALAILAFVTWRVYVKMAWLSGSMETHSLIMMRLAAERAGVRTVWWDPDLGKPPTNRVHGEDAKLETIYLYVAPHERANYKSAPKMARFRRWLNGGM